MGNVDTDLELQYLRKNVYQVAEHLKHINWNLGRLVAHLENNEELLKEIKKEQDEVDS